MREPNKTLSPQFSMRAILWVVVAVSIVLVGVRDDPTWATGLGFLILGAALMLNDCLRGDEARIGAMQLLLGAAAFAACCGLMFGLAYLQLTTPRSGILDYVAFAAILFAFFYGLWIRSTNQVGRWTSMAGYFAWVLGASILNHVLFETIIRRLR